MSNLAFVERQWEIMESAERLQPPQCTSLVMTASGDGKEYLSAAVPLLQWGLPDAFRRELSNPRYESL